MRDRLDRSYNILLSLSRKVLLLSILVSTSQLFSQSRKLEKAIDKYEYGFYNEAIVLLKEVIREDKNSYTPLKFLANSYRKIKDYQNAELYFTLLVNSDSAQAEDFLYYGQALKSNGKLAAAKEQFIKFSETSESSFLGKLMLQSIDQINAWEDQPKSYRVIKTEELNSVHSEYGAVLFKDKIYITSDREENLNSTETFSWNDKPFLSIYELDTADIGDPEVFFKEVKGRLNTIYHDGPLTINEQEDKTIITRVDNQMGGKDFTNRMKMYEGIHENDNWKKFKPLPFNSDEYSVGHAHYSDSGNTIYFASDMPGGFGGFDLYKSERIKGVWSDPENLGPVVNTSKNEVFPFLLGNELYFSSNGFPGYGELDIMVSQFKNDGWTAPQNLKSPINSNRDDFGIYFGTDTSGYFSSNREGGLGLDDIYGFIKYGDNIEISGVFEYDGLPVANTKIILLDANDSIIGIEYTDADGNFIFSNLTYQEDYIFQIESEDPELVDDGRLYITDKKGEKVKLIERIQNGEFVFKALPVDEVVEIELAAAEDEAMMEELKFVGQVFEELPGDMEEEIVVYLIDGQGEVIDSTVTNEEGFFEFSTLPASENYMVKVKEEDTEMKIAFINDEKRVYSVEELDENGSLVIEPSMDASKLVRQAKNQGYTTLIAKLENKGAPISNTIVEIYDKDDNLISTVITNDKGEFQYNMLEYEKNYFIKIPQLDEDMKDESLLYVVKEDGTPLYLINLIDNGSYEFKSLPYEEYEGVIEEEKKFVPNEVQMSGVIFNDELEDTEEGVMVYLIGEDGRIVDSTETGEDGEFTFEKLNPDENYSFQLSGVPTDYTLALVDEENRILETSKPTESGSFEYQKLTYQLAQFEPLTTEEVEIIEEQYDHEVKGKLFKKLPGDMAAGTKVFLYNSEGELLRTTTIDSEGNFEFKKLDEDQNYIFRIEDPEEDLRIVTLDEDNKPVTTTIRTDGTEFMYSPLGFIETKFEEKELVEVETIGITKDGRVAYKAVDKDGKFMVFYSYNSSELDKESRQKLNNFILLFAEDDFLIEVESHTDNRGSQAYNIALSKRRTKAVNDYLIKNGIESSRIQARNFGELKPLIDCETKDCDEEEHRLNRRTEIKVKE